jgi:hypothetical protein
LEIKMNLYIKYVNNEIVNHPILESNLYYTIVNFNPDALPGDLKKFERIPTPAPSGPYVRIETTYTLGDDDIVRDVHFEVEITAEEKAAKIAVAREVEHPASWTFDETVCAWAPPVAYPTDGKFYTWNEETTSWVEIIPIAE